MRTARAAARLLAALPELAEKGNPNAASDVGAAALLLDACAEGALLNVGINLSGIEDAALVAEMQRETARSPGGLAAIPVARRGDGAEEVLGVGRRRRLT